MELHGQVNLLIVSPHMTAHMAASMLRLTHTAMIVACSYKSTFLSALDGEFCCVELGTP